MKKQVKKELLFLCGIGALALYATKRRRAMFAPLAAAGIIALQKSDTDSFVEHSVVITGGSRGLGLALAKQFVLEGANVSILARDKEELARAHAMLSALEADGQIHTVVCDVTKPDQIKKSFSEIAAKFGAIDLLLNNAGAITVGPFETMEQADYEAQMNLHVYAPMNAIRCALPYLRREGSGKRIVNICSLGGRVAVPHMLPYDTSKFALSGFSQGVAAELAPEGISVTTIYPTLMRTGSPIQAVFKGDHEKEYAWFQTGDVMPGISMSAESAAKSIVEAARERRSELMPTSLGKLRMAAAAFFPELLAEVMAIMSSMMPKGQSKEYKTGAQSRALFEQNPATMLLTDRVRETERENNQVPKKDARYNMNLH